MNESAATVDDSLAASMRPPKRVGQYELCHKIASGGMATVYLARKEGAAGFQKVVALKLIHPHLADNRDFVDMFLDEARIASLIQHPNVCSVHDFGEVGGLYYLAMDYLVGEPLNRVFHARAKREISTVGVATLAHIGSEVCKALHAAHEARDENGEALSVVHRDVSPHNVIVGFDGVARLLDFGVARAANRLSETRTGTLKGKSSYMAPEQVLSGREVDCRSDIWGLGVTLWELLTGKRLFRRDGEADTIYAVVNDPVVKPSTHAPNIPERLDEIIMKMLEREQDDRYQNAQDCARDLAAFQEEFHTLLPGDTAAWLEELLPKGRERREDLVDQALTMSLRTLDFVGLGPGSGSRPKSPTPTAVPVTTSAAAAPAPNLAPAATEKGGWLHTALFRAVIVLGVIAIAIAGYIFSYERTQGGTVSEEQRAIAWNTVPVGGAATSTMGAPTGPKPPSEAATTTMGEAAPANVEGTTTTPAANTTPSAMSGSTATPVAPITTMGTPTMAASTPSTATTRPSTMSATTPSTGNTARPTTTRAPVMRATRPTPAMRPTAAMATRPIATRPITTRPSTSPRMTSSTMTSATGTGMSAATMGSPMTTAMLPANPTGPPGRLNLATPGGWANVFHNGRLLGRTPRAFRLPSGRQRLSIQPFGEGPRQTITVEIPADGVARRSVPVSRP